MGEPVNISLGYRSNPSRNKQAGNGRLINCYAEETGEDAKTTWTIYATAGLTNFGTALEGGSVRAMIAVNDVLYVVAGRNIYAVSSAGVGVRIGGLPTDGPVYMERNRKQPPQIGVVSDGLYYVIDTTSNSVTEVVSAFLPSPISISNLDGYFIIPIPNARFMLTGIDEATSIDGLDEGTAEAYPDEIVRSMVLERELILLGRESLEIFQNTGDADFPFTRVHATELGCLAGDSVAKADTPSRKTVLWVAPDHTVRMMSGYSGERVSTNEIEQLIKTLHEAGNVSQLKAFAWSDGGRFFYALGCSSWTRVLDMKTMNWHERKSYGLDRWRVTSVVQFGTKLIAGDYSTGQLYVMGDNYYMEGAQVLIPEIITPHVHAFPYRLALNALYVDAARGVGLNSSVDHIADPKILISWSKDSGLSWSAERERSLGIQGHSAKRVQPIYRLGTAGQHGLQFRVRIPAPVERVIMSASLDFERLGA